MEQQMGPTEADLSNIEPAIRRLAVRIETLRPDPHNARRHGDKNMETICRSLSGFGQQKPIVVDAEGTCVAGNGTLEAARRLGWKWIAVIPTTLPPGQAHAYGLADNRTTELSEWDDPELAEVLKSLSDDEQTLTGFEDDEIDRIIGQESDADITQHPEYLDRPPTMAWVLIGIPTVRHGEIAEQIEALALIEGIIIETTVNDGKRG